MNDKATIVKSLFEEEGVDLIIATSPHNVCYLTGTTLTNCLVIFSKQNSTPILITSLAEGMSPVPSSIYDTRFYGEFYIHFSEPLTPREKLFQKSYNDYYSKGIKDAPSALVKYIANEKLSANFLGIEKDHMSSKMGEVLQESFPKAKFKDISFPLRKMRAIKTTDEIKKLELVADINEKSLKKAIDAMRVGASEKELAEVYLTELIRRNAEPIFCHVDSGSFSAFSSRYASEKRIRKGEVVRFDVGCKYNGYCADLSRTKVLGSPSNKIKCLWDAVSRGEWETLNSLKPGLGIKDVFKKAMSAIVQAGIPNIRRSNVGHGIGVEMHELPDLSLHSTGQLQKNMVINIETPFYCVGLGGFSVEDTVVLIKDGIKLLTHLNRDLCI